jgi:hypothetical protein
MSGNNSNNFENCAKTCASVGAIGAGAAKTGFWASLGAWASSASTAASTSLAAVSGGASTASAATLAFLATPVGMGVGALVGGTVLVGGIYVLVSNGSSKTDGATKSLLKKVSNVSPKTDEATEILPEQPPKYIHPPIPPDIYIDHLEKIVRNGTVNGVSIEKMLADCFRTGDININPSIVINGSQSSLYLYFAFIFAFLLALCLYLLEHSDVIHFPIS